METPAAGVHFELLPADYLAMSKHVCAPDPGSLWIGRLLWLGSVFVASFTLALLGRSGWAFLAGMGAGFLLMLVKVLRTQRRLQPRPGGAVLCRYDVQLTSSGVHLQTANWTSEVRWHGILAVEETAAHCFLRVDTAGVYTVPKRSFPNTEAMRQFVDFARNSVSRAQAGGTQNDAEAR